MDSLEGVNGDFLCIISTVMFNCLLFCFCFNYFYLFFVFGCQVSNKGKDFSYIL